MAGQCRKSRWLLFRGCLGQPNRDGPKRNTYGYAAEDAAGHVQHGDESPNDSADAHPKNCSASDNSDLKFHAPSKVPTYQRSNQSGTGDAEDAKQSSSGST